MRIDDILNKKTLTVSQLADKHGVPVEQIQQQLAKGIKVELEHTSHPDVAKEIALDHLGEFPDYYDRLTQAEKINESTDFNNKFVKKFLPWIKKELGITELPKIKLVNELPTKSFGTYDSNSNILYVVTAGRHPVDVLRTLAHELTHHIQNIENRLGPDSGETGTDEENEANANAGIVMRNFAQENPEYLKAGVNEDFTGRGKPGSRPGSLRRKAGLKKGETMSQADLLRLQGRATEMKRSSNKATRERGIQLARQINWYKNFHKKKSEAVGYE